MIGAILTGVILSDEPVDQLTPMGLVVRRAGILAEMHAPTAWLRHNQHARPSQALHQRRESVLQAIERLVIKADDALLQLFASVLEARTCARAGARQA